MAAVAPGRHAARELAEALAARGLESFPLAVPRRGARRFAQALLPALGARAAALDLRDADLDPGLVSLFVDRVVPRAGSLDELAAELERRLAGRGWGGLRSEPLAEGALRPLLLVPGFDRTGGMERQAWLQARELARRGHHPLLLTNPIGPAQPAQELREGVAIVRLPSPPQLWPLRKARAFRAFVARYGPTHDLLHASAFYEIVGPALAQARALGLATFAKVATEGDVDQLYQRRDPYARLGRRGLRQVDGLLAISAPIARELERNGVPAAAIERLPNGVDVARFRPASPAERSALRAELGLGAGAPLACFVGRLVARKAVDLLLRAFAQVQPPAQLLIVGEGEERPALERLSRALGLSERVRFLGLRQDVPALLAACDVFAFLSRREGQPNALLEAMACGLAVVAADTPALRSALDESCARLVPPEDPAAAAAALSELLADPAQRAELGQRARARIDAELSLPAVVDRLEALYRSRLR